MESTVKQSPLFLSLGLGAIFCLGLFACSPDSATETVDAAKRDGSGSGGKGSGGSAGSGGSSARGGSGGSQAGGSQAGGSQAGGSQAGGSQAGGSQAGGSQAGGSQAGGSQAGGSQAGGAGGGGSGGTVVGTGGSTQPKDGSTLDGSGSDAEDAPLTDKDGPAGETPASDDGGIPPVLDGGGVDFGTPDSTVLLDGAVLLDAEIDTAEPDVGADAAEDSAPDTAMDKPDAGNCLEQIIASSYAVGGQACSACKESSGQQNSLETQCKTMVDCLAAAACTNKNSSNNCFLNCQNAVTGGNQVETGACVAALMTAASCPTE
jgi:hypothetical protein